MTRPAHAHTAPDGALAAAALLTEARPADALEAMIVEQMAAVHAAAMRCLARAEEHAGDTQVEALYLRHAARLLNLFQRQSDALDRRRIKAEERDAMHDRDERLADRAWQEDCRIARGEGKRPPKRPAPKGAMWPAWGAGAEGKGAANGAGRSVKPRNGNGRGTNGCRNGTASPG